jgi:hypothetical protein
MGVHGDLVLGGITNKSLVVREGHVGWSCTVSLIVSNYFYTIMLPYTNAARKRYECHECHEGLECSRVGCTKVNADSFRRGRHDESEKVNVKQTSESTNYISFCNLWNKPEYLRNIWNAVVQFRHVPVFVTFVAHGYIQRLL